MVKFDNILFTTDFSRFANHALPLHFNLQKYIRMIIAVQIQDILYNQVFEYLYIERGAFSGDT